MTAFQRRALEEFERRYTRDPETGCWVWEGAFKRKGEYPVFRFRNTEEGATRFIWRMANGRIPKERALIRKCGNLRCVNPAHLKVRERTRYRPGRPCEECGTPMKGAYGVRCRDCANFNAQRKERSLAPGYIRNRYETFRARRKK